MKTQKMILEDDDEQVVVYDSFVENKIRIRFSPTRHSGNTPIIEIYNQRLSKKRVLVSFDINHDITLDTVFSPKKGKRKLSLECARKEGLKDKQASN